MTKKQAEPATIGWTHRARELMTAKGLTYADLMAPLAVTTVGAVGNYLHARREISVEQAVALARALACPLEWLLTGEQSGESSPKRTKAEPLPEPDELYAMLRGLPPTTYAAMAHLIVSLAPRGQSPKKKRSAGRKGR